MAESRTERLARIQAYADSGYQYRRRMSARTPEGGTVYVAAEDVAWLLEQIPEEWPCPNPDDPAGCWCPTRSGEHLEGAS